MDGDEQRLQRMLDLGRLLVGELDLEVVLERLLEAARELTGARYAALGIPDARGEELERFLTVGIDEATRREIGDLPRGHVVLGVLLHDPRPLRMRSVSDHPRSYGFPVRHPRMESFLGVPVRIGGQVFGNVYLTDKQGAEEFDSSDEQTLIALADWAAIAIANARRHTETLAQRDELLRAVQAFETAETIGGALAGETELERILELVVKRSRALVEARAMVLALLEGDELVIRAASGEVEDGHFGLTIPLAESLSGQVLSSGRAQRLSDSTPGVRAVLLRLFGAHTELAAPLRFRGRAVGVLAALDRLRDGPEFTAEDERLMTAFATSVAAAVATARDVAAQALQRSLEASERERSRWARELHDQTLQDLGALKVMLSGARKTRDRDEVDRVLDQAVEQVQLGVDALRGLITELRPAALDDLGTAAALRALVARTVAAAGVEPDLTVDLAYEGGRAATRHVPELESAMYRLVQEALANVVKHADAGHVTITVTEDDTAVHLQVSDDGSGFQTAAASAGFGLLGMRERVALLGGQLTISSQPGAGTTVAARLPAERRSDDRPPPTAQSGSARRSA